ncbi:hypothetical protein Lxx24790 [Leifsonia xyli subsp. xyli str. CTCB07]|uniref:Uncharacterized protein n=1 Tax=Leifsonia xyli subsp. xyli (strain CTCB07) TaxID=281090 RepID=Q6AC00_LEIXX|nr:hypothetical protein [Leifsonia xyli]AAT90092.1 hypothetical protein Lxx24790 [Leifsonia xyli subsp. xyli str. CTCB07]
MGRPRRQRLAGLHPEEAGHTGMLPPALNRVAATMLRYQSAFQAARAEARAAITDAKTA